MKTNIAYQCEWLISNQEKSSRLADESIRLSQSNHSMKACSHIDLPESSGGQGEKERGLVTALWTNCTACSWPELSYTIVHSTTYRTHPVRKAASNMTMSKCPWPVGCSIPDTWVEFGLVWPRTGCLLTPLMSECWGWSNLLTRPPLPPYLRAG